MLKVLYFLEGVSSPSFFWLPESIGKSSKSFAIYGGGGMLRPTFSKREVFQDFSMRTSDYSIKGVGINFDIKAPKITTEDIIGMKKWVEAATSVSVRDLQSFEFVKKFSDRPIRLEPCPSYFLIKNETLSEPQFEKKFEYGIVPSIGHTKTYQSFEKEIIYFCKNFIKRKEKTRFICHDLEDYFRLRCIFGDNENVDIQCPRTALEVAKCYGECCAVISMRAHGVIFSAAMNLPVSFFPFSDKVNSLYEYHYQDNGTAEISFDPEVHISNIANKSHRSPFNKFQSHSF